MQFDSDDTACESSNVKCLLSVLTVSLVALLQACADPAADPKDATTSIDGPATTDSRLDARPDAPATCPTAPVASTLTSLTNFGANPGNLTAAVYVPTIKPPHPALVIALHGCSQTGAAYAKTGWNQLADHNGFIVAYPQTTANNACFNWFSTSEQTRTGDEVTSIVSIINTLKQTYSVDSTRIYVTGLSAGGAMTALLLATHPEIFVAGAVMAGLPFRCAGNASEGLSCMSASPTKTPAQWGDLVRTAAGSSLTRAPRLSIWHGSNDGTVNNSNALAMVAQFTNVNGIDAIADATTTVGAATHREYRNAAGVTLVDYWSVAGMNHGVALDLRNGCGTAGPFLLDQGLCSSRAAADFFGVAACSPP